MSKRLAVFVPVRMRRDQKAYLRKLARLRDTDVSAVVRDIVDEHQRRESGSESESDSAAVNLQTPVGMAA